MLNFSYFMLVAIVLGLILIGIFAKVLRKIGPKIEVKASGTTLFLLRLVAAVIFGIIGFFAGLLLFEIVSGFFGDLWSTDAGGDAFLIEFPKYIPMISGVISGLILQLRFCMLSLVSIVLSVVAYLVFGIVALVVGGITGMGVGLLVVSSIASILVPNIITHKIRVAALNNK